MVLVEVMVLVALMEAIVVIPASPSHSAQALGVLARNDLFGTAVLGCQAHGAMPCRLLCDACG